MRDRLIEMLKKIKYFHRKHGLKVHLDTQVSEYGLEQIVDCLLSEGVIVPPVKVEQTVYVITEKHPCYACRTVADNCHIDCHSFGDRTELVVKEGLVEAVLFFSGDNEMRIAVPTTKYLMRHYITKRFSDFGKTVFLAREEAEKALAERSENG